VPPLMYDSHRRSPAGVSMLPLPVLSGSSRTRQERLRRRLRRSSTLDRTCPKVPEFAAIGSRDRRGQDSGAGCGVDGSTMAFTPWAIGSPSITPWAIGSPSIQIPLERVAAFRRQACGRSQPGHCHDDGHLGAPVHRQTCHRRQRDELDHVLSSPCFLRLTPCVAMHCHVPQPRR